jgi:hypothetical protein
VILSYLEDGNQRSKKSAAYECIFRYTRIKTPGFSATLVQIYRTNRSHSSTLKMETIVLPKHWNPFTKLHSVKRHHFDKYNKFLRVNRKPSIVTRMWKIYSVPCHSTLKMFCCIFMITDSLAAR